MGFLWCTSNFSNPNFLLLLFQKSQLHCDFRKRGTDRAETGKSESFTFFNLVHVVLAPPPCAATQICIFWNCWKVLCIIQARQKGFCWPSNMPVVDKIRSLDVQICKCVLRNWTLHWIRAQILYEDCLSDCCLPLSQKKHYQKITKLMNMLLFFTCKRKAALPSHICFFDLTPCLFLLAMDEWFGKCVAAHFTEEKGFLVE